MWLKHKAAVNGRVRLDSSICNPLSSIHSIRWYCFQLGETFKGINDLQNKNESLKNAVGIKSFDVPSK